MTSLRVMIWNEYRHERTSEKVKAIYPEGIHAAIAKGLDAAMSVRFATFDEPEHGLTEEALAETDVLIWWAHLTHRHMNDDVIERVHRRVLDGMGLIVLHSGHNSKLFKKLMGTTCNLKWRNEGEKERIWVVDPTHPIVEGIGPYFELQQEEMYGEHFDIPPPDELVLASWFAGGELFRSGCTFRRGSGRIFYFRPGHETYPTYRHPDVLKVIRNAVVWAAPGNRAKPAYGNHAPLETLTPYERTGEGQS
ncbi:MAG: trehalose utilization protein ThuA [Paenibacillus sp.]|nr:trehalose utilization protein ThuA [Paenibacillus sp.]